MFIFFPRLWHQPDIPGTNYIRRELRPGYYRWQKVLRVFPGVWRRHPSPPFMLDDYGFSRGRNPRGYRSSRHGQD